ncbi:GNAT family N-acetyltransferase [Catellatospora coxensis]
MTYEVRPLGPDDNKLAWDLGSLAFGYHEQPMPETWNSNSPGRHTLGVFDPAGRMVAKAVDREQGQWFGGRIVPTSGVAGVATAPELRGRGLGRLVLTRLLEGRASAGRCSAPCSTPPRCRTGHWAGRRSASWSTGRCPPGCSARSAPTRRPRCGPRPRTTSRPCTRSTARSPARARA